MKLAATCAALTCIALSLSGAAAAQVAPSDGSLSRSWRVDDSASVVLDPYLEMQWQPVGRSAPSNIVSASTRVSVRLNLAPWVGKAGRIYMTLPRTSGPTIRASWTTGGGLLPGTLISGDRTLVYAGPINAERMTDLIDITLEADGTRLDEPEALSFGFEIEVDP